MSKKKKMILGAISAALVFVIIMSAILAIVERQNDIKRAREEYEQAQNATHTPDTSETNVPPIVIPDDTGEETGKDDIILDVTDKDRTPDPGVTDVTVEYGTKEGIDDAE